MPFYGSVKTEEPRRAAISPLQALRRLAGFLHPYRSYVAATLAFVFASTFLHSLPPLVLREGLNQAAGRESLDVNYFLALGGVFFGLHLVAAAISYAQQVAATRWGEAMVRDIRVSLFQHLQSLSLKFYDGRQTGELMSRVLNDVDRLEWGVADSILQILNNALMFAWQLALMMYVNVQLSLVAIAAVPFMFLFTYRYNIMAHEVFHELRERMASITTCIQENIAGIRVVKTFCREEHESKKFRTESDSYFDLAMQATRMTAFAGNIVSLFGITAAAIVFGYGGWLVLKGHIGIGDLVAVLLYTSMLYDPINALIQANYQIHRSAVAAERVFDILDTPPEITDPPDPVSAPSLHGRIEFRGVSFSYGGDQPVLRNITLDAHPGQTVAIVGRSGSGKSTLINLIPRLYDVQHGAVCVDGNDVRLIRNTDLRKNIAMVMQDVFLFNGTIRQNIGYGNLDASDDEITAAAKAAHVDEFVDQLPAGYDTEIGERGAKLSGGQRQRIAVARAFLAGARILLLDEPTSNIDTHSERLIQEALERLGRDRTTFVVAHRLSTVLKADKIVLLDRGRIAATGTHAQLLEGSALYAHLYRTQLEAV